MAILLKGKPVAEKLKTEIRTFSEKYKITMAVIQIGNDPASTAYRKFKVRQAAKLGVRVEEYLFDEYVPSEKILTLFERLNSREEINGIFLEQPVPKNYRKELLTEAISPLKDIDGITKGNVSALYFGENGIFPATARSVMAILEYYDVEIRGKHAVVIGRSNVVGKPLALMLMHADATVTVCHSRTSDLKTVVLRGDIVLAAVGKAGLIDSSYIKNDAVVIDAGYNVIGDTVLGDVDFSDAEPNCKMITPVPGGVGTVTNTMVFANLIQAYKIQHGL